MTVLNVSRETWLPIQLVGHAEGSICRRLSYCDTKTVIEWEQHASANLQVGCCMGTADGTMITLSWVLETDDAARFPCAVFLHIFAPVDRGSGQFGLHLRWATQVLLLNPGFRRGVRPILTGSLRLTMTLP